MKHFFIPGTHPDLTKAELLSLDSGASIVSDEKGTMVLELSKDLGSITNAAAGIVKAGEIVAEVPRYEKDTIAAMMFGMIDTDAEKVKFGISLYGASNLKKEVEPLGLTIKKMFKAGDRKARFVTSKDPTLSAVVVSKNKLLEDGAEFVLIASGEKILIGQTMFVQDFEDWSDRDFGRPARDSKSGMLPPKLARMMVNLSGKNPSKNSLWDPFCGSGTILMEASLVGFEEIVGSDISEKAISDTNQNLQWLKIKNIETFVHDATESLPEPRTFDAIVAEGYLGPPNFAADSKAELEELYNKSFPKLSESLSKDGVIIFALPYYGTNEFLEVDFGDLQVIPFDGKETSPRGGLLYQRKGQRVGREIVRLQKK